MFIILYLINVYMKYVLFITLYIYINYTVITHHYNTLYNIYNTYNIINFCNICITNAYII